MAIVLVWFLVFDLRGGGRSLRRVVAIDEGRSRPQPSLPRSRSRRHRSRASRITSTKLADSRFVARKVGTVAFHLYAAPSYVARHGEPRSTSDFAGHEWVWFRSAGKALLRSGVGVGARILCDDLFFVREAARHGAGIAALPPFFVEDDRKTGTLVRVCPRWTFASSTAYVVHRPPKQLPLRVAAFRDVVTEVLRQRPLG